MAVWKKDKLLNRKRIFRLAIALFSAGLFAWNALAEDPSAQKPVLTVPFLKKAPVLDGHVKQGEWVCAAQVTGFLTTAGQLAQRQTTVRAGYDAENLYFAFVSHCPSPIRKVITERDGQVTRDDAFEIYLQPDAGTRRYHFFAGNALGTGQDAYGDDGKLQFEWNADWGPGSSGERHPCRQ